MSLRSKVPVTWSLACPAPSGRDKGNASHLCTREARIAQREAAREIVLFCRVISHVMHQLRQSLAYKITNANKLLLCLYFLSKYDIFTQIFQALYHIVSGI